MLLCVSFHIHCNSNSVAVFGTAYSAVFWDDPALSNVDHIDHSNCQWIGYNYDIEM